jgi:hypothetical protein
MGEKRVTDTAATQHVWEKRKREKNGPACEKTHNLSDTFFGS